MSRLKLKVLIATEAYHFESFRRYVSKLDSYQNTLLLVVPVGERLLTQSAFLCRERKNCLAGTSPKLNFELNCQEIRAILLEAKAYSA